MSLRFYWRKGQRYWRRRAEHKRKLVALYSAPDVVDAVGRHAEMMFDAALPRAGFMPVGWNTREWEGRRWEQTQHNLDRIFVRDGIAYGAEVKNKLAYIERSEYIFFAQLLLTSRESEVKFTNPRSTPPQILTGPY